jgi:hypothetical protein
LDKSHLLGAMCALFLVFSISAQAVTINEISPDAGELVATAQDTTGTGASLDSINGTLVNLGTGVAPIDDIDLFKILITDPAAFSVTVTALWSESNDAMTTGDRA